MTSTTKTLAVLSALTLFTGTAHAAPIAQFDAGSSNLLASGFEAITQNSSATQNGVTLTNTHSNTAVRAASALSPAELYRDFFYNNGTYTLSGLDASTDYVVTIYNYDNDATTNSNYYIGANDGTPDVISNSTDSNVVFDLAVTSDGDGEVLITVTNARFNGLEVSAVPEPGSLALMALGGLCVLRRRRA